MVIPADDLPPLTPSPDESVRRLRRFIPSVVADSLLHNQDQLRGERREIAVLFADAVGFTHLSVSLDAESIFNLINDLLGRLMECIQRYDGMVDKFTGDGLMAVFGAPIAHENDPELAVRAALDMQKAAAEFESIARAQLGAPLQIRIGIHSGPAVAGIIGTPQQAAYTVIGETVNLASRLQSMARAGSILTSERVYHQTQAFFHFQAADTLPVKGLDQPIAVYEAVSDRPEPLAARGIAGVSRVYLGHDADLAHLRELSTAFVEDRHGRLVIIQGEAGLGKSRLVQEWLSSANLSATNIWQGRGLPYAQGVGYGAFRSLMHDALQSYSSPDDLDDKISVSLRPFLRTIVGLPLAADEQLALRNLEPERVKQLISLAFREWIMFEADLKPLILILDDFHWADDLSRDLLQSASNLIEETAVLLCVMTRPQANLPLKIEPSPAGSVRPKNLLVELKPLSAEDSRALLGHLVHLADLPEQVINTILVRSEGNPFYIEEFVRVLIEKDVLRLRDGQWRVASAIDLQTLDIPTSLRGLMMTRVDRLPRELQDVLRSASVLGLQFPARLLEEIERRLHSTTNVLPMVERLIDIGLLEERPETNEQFYAFTHILTQETIYNSLLHAQRPSMHRTVAESIETLYADDLRNQSEVLSLHYDRARVRDKAMYFTALAGERARERFANHEAIEYYGRALQLSQHLTGFEAARWQAAVGLGQVQQLIGGYEEAIAFYQAALEEWVEAPPVERARTLLRLGQVWDKRGNLQEAEQWLRQGLAQIDRVENAAPEVRAQIYSELGWIVLRRGDLPSAQDWFQQGLALVEHTQHYGVLASILNRLGAIYYNRSEWKQAAEVVQQALELRERMGDVVGHARSLNNLGILKQASGDWDGALTDYLRAVEMHERIGEVEGLALACTNLGGLYTERGDWAQAEQYLLRSFEIVRRIAHPFELAQAYMNLGRLYLMQEHWSECARHLNSAIPLYTEVGANANLNLNDAYYLQGVLQLEQGQLDQAKQWAQRSYDLLREVTESEQGESVEWGRYEQLAGRIAIADGDLAEARLHFDRSAAIFKTNGVLIEAGRTAYWSAQLWQKMQRPEEARADLQLARSIFTQLGAAADLKLIDRLTG
jgi:class 3 adenylate cyclase/tetratricopeptide (TPR) repeat protein